MSYKRWSSVSRHIIAGVLFEIVIVTAVLSVWAGMSIWAAAGVAIIFLFIVRILLALFSFLVAWWFGIRHHKTRTLTVFTTAALISREILAFFELFFIYHPFEPLLNRHDPTREHEATGATPVLLVHGFFANAGFWCRFKSTLQSQGISALYTLNLDPPFADIDDYADQLAQRVRQVCAHSGQDKVLLIGQSMGGLVCRAYVHKCGVHAVRQIITLGSPHHGTVLAYLLGGANLKQMRPRSAWLNELNATIIDIPQVTVFSIHDNIVVPQNSSALPGAQEVILTGMGHLSMAFSEELAGEVVALIRNGTQNA